MIYIKAFIFCGLVCALSQYALEKTKLTPGHINTSLVVIGCALSGFKIYDKFIDLFGAGATVPIVNFGHLLVTGAEKLFNEEGVIGLFKGIFLNAGAGISFAICSAFVMSLIFKIKN